jgi:hypothetical protein
MELRSELMPPPLDAALVARLAKLADRIDGAAPGQRDDDWAEFNRLAGTNLPPSPTSRGIYPPCISSPPIASRSAPRPT